MGTIAKSLILYADRVYMWTSDDIEVEIESVEYTEMIVAIKTPVGVVSLAGCVTRTEGLLRISGAHIGGLWRGALGRAGLNAIAQKVMEVADVEEIVIQGGVRTTGRNRGRPPREFRFTRLRSRTSCRGAH